jgi:hypothetical protein
VRRRGGIEPPTRGFSVRRSIQLAWALHTDEPPSSPPARSFSPSSVFWSRNGATRRGLPQPRNTRSPRQSRCPASKERQSARACRQRQWSNSNRRRLPRNQRPSSLWSSPWSSHGSRLRACHPMYGPAPPSAWLSAISTGGSASRRRFPSSNARLRTRTSCRNGQAASPARRGIPRPRRPRNFRRSSKRACHRPWTPRRCGDYVRHERLRPALQQKVTLIPICDWSICRVERTATGSCVGSEK